MRLFGKKTASILPTRRFAAAAALGSVWFFAMPWIGSVGLCLGIAHNLAIIALAFLDYAWLRDARGCRAFRDCGSVLSINEQNPVWIQVDHRGTRPLTVLACDEPPVEFEAPSRSLTFHMEPNETQRGNYKVRPLERGDYMFGDLNLRFITRLGLVALQEMIPASKPVKVYPDVLQTKKHLLLMKEQRVTHMGLRKSKLQGQGQEFERLRDYVPDDPLRHVDWKATARRSVLTTREFDVERSQNIILLIDLGRTMSSRTVEADGKPGISKADCAINASVLLAHVAAQSDDRVGLFCFASSPVAYVPPGKGNTQASRLMESLYSLQPRTEESNYYENLLFLTQKQRKRSLVFLFTDLIDPDSSKRLISAVGLLAKKHVVVCVALADYELPAIIEAEPLNPRDLYTQTVALSLIKERKKALAQLAGMGVLTVDAAPSDLSVATVNRYLQLKREARL